MSALLTDNLSLLTVAPNGVKKLRELILELAMRGKLVPQDAGDESASGLLGRIAKEQRRLEAEINIKAQKVAPDLSGDEIPFEVPASWRWVRVATVGHGWGQKTPDQDFTYIDVGCVDNVSGKILSPNVVPVDAAPSRARKIVKPGTLLYSTIRPYLLNVAVVEDVYANEPIASTAFAVVCPYAGMPARYFFWYLRSPVFVRYVESVQMGIAYPAINDSQFFKGPVPLPPLGEQHRIVDKIDELMAFCDRLEAKQAGAETAHAHLVQTLLESLRRSVNAADFSASWQRLSEHFQTLFTTEASIDALRQAVLELAVIGKLTHQDCSDESASVLLERIQRMRSGRGDKKPKLLAKSSGQEHPFELPKNWEWTTLPAVGELSRGKSRHRPRNDPSLYVGGSIPLVQTGDVARAHGVVRTHSAMYNAEGLAQSRLWPVGTMCITIAANIADSAILGFEACFPDSVVGFIPDLPELDVRYFEFFLRTAKSNLQNFAPSTAQKNINLEILGLLSVPLPPANEMHRIVSKVDHVMALCDQLKASQKKARELSDALADAIVAAAIAEKPPASCSSAIYLSSYLVRKLASRPTFGRTAHMKWLFLADQHLGLELGMTYERQAAGPLDKLIYQVEEQAAQSQLYATQKETLKSGIEKIVYRPAAAIDRAADAGAAELGDKRAELDRLIGLLGGHKTEDLEIVATLYAVWNDALAEGQQPDDGWLINEFRTNWHKGKERFSPELLAKWLSWMREHRLVPVGKISSTRHQGSLLH
ncbi:restriction endonuclease subunit S [Stenotrophomonas sp.]|uniref:restriction endonuclease subunit S n=1 Tax=Stenotrophomonas sp. TaxID=69392 RepID=UPI0028ADFEFF|nr:restriction endonuclease subunit S [Stenotrophomonas sp.]